MKTLLALCLAFSSSAWSSECGMGGLSQDEINQIIAGQVVQKADFSGGIDSYEIESWGLVTASSTESAAAQYYDYQTYQGENLVEDIALAPGYQASDNPVRFNVTPKENNPFGDLYQPFSFELSVSQTAGFYSFQFKTLTSPNLVRAWDTVSCLSEMDGKMIWRSSTQFIGNPKIGFDKINEPTRVAIWEGLVKATIQTLSKPASSKQLANLQKALSER